MEEPKYEELELACNNCNLIFRLKEMKIDPESNKLVCVNCFNNPHCKISRIK